MRAESNFKIKILSPLDGLGEIEPLIASGADEFFCGVFLGGESLSAARAAEACRCNLRNIKELQDVVKIAHARGRSVFLAMNVPYVMKGYERIVKNNLEKIRDIEIDGIIVGHLDIMRLISSYFGEANLIISSHLEVKNQEAADFLNSHFKIKRIILDRQVDLRDIKSIAKKFPNIELEAFVMSSGCRSLHGACQWRYVVNPRVKTHLCYLRSEVKSKKMSSRQKKIVAARLMIPGESCGICALPFFKKYGVASLKIVGRGHSLQKKIQNVSLVRKALDILETEKNSNRKFRQKMKSLFKDSFLSSCRGEQCYYPHFY